MVVWGVMSPVHSLPTAPSNSYITTALSLDMNHLLYCNFLEDVATRLRKPYFTFTFLRKSTPKQRHVRRLEADAER